MERAALRIAEHVKERFSAGAHVVIVVESGNNGGDGIAAGRILMMEGYDVEIYWVDGLNVDLGYKDFDLSFLLQGAMGGVFYQTTESGEYAYWRGN